MTTPQQASESIYGCLLRQYLEHELPVTEQKLNFMKNSNWFSAPLSCNPSTCVSSPRKLLRPEVLAASQPLEFPGLRSVSLRSVYPRLLQFVGNLITNYSSLKAWPSVAQFVMLKLVLQYYHEFLLADTDDSDFCSLKLMLIQNPLFVNMLKAFLEKVLANWHLQKSYNNIIRKFLFYLFEFYSLVLFLELWMELVYHASLKHYNEDKLNIFVRASSNHFVDIFSTIIKRVIEDIPRANGILHFLENYVFADKGIQKIFEICGVSLVDHISFLQKNITELMLTEDTKLRNNKVVNYYYYYY